VKICSSSNPHPDVLFREPCSFNLLFSFNIISGTPQEVPDKMAKVVALDHDTAYDWRKISSRSLSHAV
jgi:hypothetical protein